MFKEVVSKLFLSVPWFIGMFIFVLSNVMLHIDRCSNPSQFCDHHALDALYDDQRELDDLEFETWDKENICALSQVDLIKLMLVNEMA